MDKFEFLSKKTVQAIVSLIGLATIVICCIIMVFFRSHIISTVVKKAVGILTPFIYGGVIAYLLRPVCTSLEKWLAKLLDKNGEGKHSGLISLISIILSLVFLLFILILLLVLVIPELINSISSIVSSVPKAIDSFIIWLKKFGDGDLIPPEVLKTVDEYIDGIYNNIESFLKTDLLPKMKVWVGGMGNGILSVLDVLKDLGLGLIISAYILGERKTFKRHSILLIKAAFSERTANWIFKEFRFIDQKFNGFLAGKLLDSTIIGIICFIFMIVARMPYALLVSIIVGVTNMIPFFGPYIGAIPSAILVLTVSPVKAVIFVIFVILLQQLDGNFIGPKILGDKLGLSSFWILFSILVFGAVWGIVGMIIGAPLFAVIYDLIRSLVHLGLRRRGIKRENDPPSADSKPDPAE